MWGIAQGCGAGCMGGHGTELRGGLSHGMGSGHGAGSTCWLQMHCLGSRPRVWHRAQGGMVGAWGGAWNVVAGRCPQRGFGGHVPVHSHVLEPAGPAHALSPCSTLRLHASPPLPYLAPCLALCDHVPMYHIPRRAMPPLSLFVGGHGMQVCGAWCGCGVVCSRRVPHGEQALGA